MRGRRRLIVLILEANRALQNWIHLTHHPNATPQQKQAAFNEYQRLQQTAVMKVEGRTTLWRDIADDLEQEYQDILDRHLPQGRRPTRMELERAIEEVERETRTRLETEFETLADNVYAEAMETAANDISGFTPQFGGRHEQTLESLMQGRGVADEFRSVSTEVGDVALDHIRDAYETGDVDPGQLVTDIVGDTTHEIRPDIERVVRSETAKIWDSAKRETYKEAEERRGEEFLYELKRDLPPTKKGNPQCDACSYAVEQTSGGVTWEEFIDICVRAATDPQYGGHPEWEPMRDSEVPLIHPNCYAGDMEVLTQEGWKRFDQCSGGEQVFTKNLDTGENEWQEPIRFIEQEPATRIHVHVEEPKFAVTAYHEMLTGGRTYDFDHDDPKYDHTWRKTPLVDLLTLDRFFVPKLNTELNWTRQGLVVDTSNIAARDAREGEKVYCFTVPNGTLYVRHRDGAPFFCGNCRHTHSRVQPD